MRETINEKHRHKFLFEKLNFQWDTISKQFLTSRLINNLGSSMTILLLWFEHWINAAEDNAYNQTVYAMDKIYLYCFIWVGGNGGTKCICNTADGNWSRTSVERAKKIKFPSNFCIYPDPLCHARQRRTNIHTCDYELSISGTTQNICEHRNVLSFFGLAFFSFPPFLGCLMGYEPRLRALHAIFSRTLDGALSTDTPYTHHRVYFRMQTVRVLS